MARRGRIGGTIAHTRTGFNVTDKLNAGTSRMDGNRFIDVTRPHGEPFTRRNAARLANRLRGKSINVRNFRQGQRFRDSDGNISRWLHGNINVRPGSGTRHASTGHRGG